VLPIGEHTAVHLAQLLAGERRDRRTRRGRRAVGPWRQAVLVLRWFLDGTRVAVVVVQVATMADPPRRLLLGSDAVAAAAAAGQARVTEDAAWEAVSRSTDRDAALPCPAQEPTQPPVSRLPPRNGHRRLTDRPVGAATRRGVGPADSEIDHASDSTDTNGPGTAPRGGYSIKKKIPSTSIPLFVNLSM
jgi:hypothetical protein